MVTFSTRTVLSLAVLAVSTGVAASFQPGQVPHAPRPLPKSHAAPAASFLAELPMGPPDAILGLAADFKACAAPQKVNLVVGAYRDAHGQPWVLPSVKEAEKRMYDDPKANKEYLPIDGDPAFVACALAFAYGAESTPLLERRVAGAQTLSGTGACRVGGAFFAKCLGQGTPIYVSDPTWGNHLAIMKEAGLEVRKYRYFDAATKGLDFAGMVADLTAAPAGSVVLLHAIAHNPTGVDPTPEQWAQLAELLAAQGLHPFFDSAYQGFASGDADADGGPLRAFVAAGHAVVLAQSFAKNFGLYGERVGTLSVVCASVEEAARVQSQLKLLIRPMYSSPPCHGSSIVKTVLSDAALAKQYYEECASMAARILAMRQLLRDELATAGSQMNWAHITDQIGMFAFTGLAAAQVEQLIAEHFVFLTKDGRISLAGVNPTNAAYIARAIHAVTKA